MRRVALIALIAMVGCGSDRSESLPAACTEGPAALIKALAKAPGAVTVDGTRISECFNRDARGDDVQVVGTTLLAAAQQLGDRARAGDQRSALQLGYLIGAARRGAKRNGLAAELIRRIESETTGLGAARGAYERGERAGSAQG